MKLPPLFQCSGRHFYFSHRPSPLLSSTPPPNTLREVDFVDTEYDRAKVPPYNGNDPLLAPGSLKALLFPPLFNKVQNKGPQGVRARYDAELPPIISIVRHPGRPVILGMDFGSILGQFWPIAVKNDEKRPNTDSRLTLFRILTGCLSYEEGRVCG